MQAKPIKFRRELNEALTHKSRFVLAIQISAESRYAQKSKFIKFAFEPKFTKF